MKIHSMMLIEPPSLSAESARELRNFLEELTNAFENHYGAQMRDWYPQCAPPESIQPRERDLFDGTEHEPPPF